MIQSSDPNKQAEISMSTILEVLNSRFDQLDVWRNWSIEDRLNNLETTKVDNSLGLKEGENVANFEQVQFHHQNGPRVCYN